MIIKFYKNDFVDPINDFISQQSETTIHKITRQIKYAQEYGLRPEVLNIKKLKGFPIWEIRILGKDNIRVFCFQQKNIVHLLHIFTKKSEKTPIKEINLALKRMKIILTSDIF